MSGHRCRALRHAFRRKYGRAPEKAGIVRRGPGWAELRESEWRKLKRGGPERFQASESTEQLVARSFERDQRRSRKAANRRRRRADRQVAA